MQSAKHKLVITKKSLFTPASDAEIVQFNTETSNALLESLAQYTNVSFRRFGFRRFNFRRYGHAFCRRLGMSAF